MAQSMEEKESQHESKFQGFLLVVAIPILFAIVVALVALSFLGINIFETAKDIGGKVPFISEIIKEDKQPSVEEFQKNIVSLEAEIKDREAKVEQLQSKIESKDTQLKRTELEKAQLQAQIEELTAIQEDNKRAFREIVKTYETMSAKSAAPIISNMKTEEAVKILTNIKPETLAAIMEKMPADEAAKYTELLTNETGSN
ncbi:MotE family protein [Mesobacillus jeotgali]|uniref:MotE family protein n=1 Tax=Mesobacillus jeotgali TaxID=129985 RepID=UPI0009A5AA9F|nr:MotE family protein [Mesobacillus jeotgali]